MTSPISHRDELKGIALAVAAAIAFGTLAIFAKIAYRTDAGPIPLLAVRFVIATIILAAIHAIRPGQKSTAARRIRTLMLLGAFGYAVESTFFFSALVYAPAGVVGLVFYSYPLWTSLIGLATRLEPYRPQLLVALLLGSVGVSLVFTIRSTDLLGPALALTAAVCVAIYLIALQVATKGVDPVASALWTSAGATGAFAVAALVVRQPFPLEAVWPAIGLGGATAIAFITLYAAIARIGSSRAAVASMLEPVTTILLGALLLDENLTWRIGLAAALIVSALPVLASTTGKGKVGAAPMA